MTTTLLRLVLQAMENHVLEATLRGHGTKPIRFDFKLRQTAANMRKLRAVARECGLIIWKPWQPGGGFVRLMPDESSAVPESEGKVAGGHGLSELIRARMALPVEKRMDFL